MPASYSTFPNAEQSEVINAVHDSLLVLAPMGTGKTRTAAAAIAKALETGIHPEQVLGVTFTNRAAEAMRSAVSEALPEVSHRVNLFNLHALCTKLLREEAGSVGLPPDFGILDEEEASDLLWQFVPTVDRNDRFRNKPMEALNAYEKFVFQYLTTSATGSTPSYFLMYRDALYRDGVIDFTGLIARTYRVLKMNDAVRERWQSRYQWILVDEVQDINMAEYRVLSLLGGKCRCLKFFGDPHQTIFEWRFAEPSAVLQSFEKEFSAKRVSLISNYRCAPSLVEISNAVRKEYISRTDPLPIASNSGEGRVRLERCDSSATELDSVVSVVREWKQSGIAWKDMAILARQNQTLSEISSHLKSAEIPHLIAEEYDFFRRREVKHVMAVLEHVVSPFRRNPIIRLLKLFGARDGSVEAFEKDAAGTGLHLGYLIKGCPGDPLVELIQSWNAGTIRAVDTETTGLDPLTAEIVQIAKVSPGSSKADFIKPKGNVGESERTHGFSDEFLASRGKSLKEVLKKYLEISLEKSDGSGVSPKRHPNAEEVWIGHNLAYDMAVLRYQAASVGLDCNLPNYFDTMPLAAACLPRESLKGLRLETVCQTLGVDLGNAHDAEADAKACLLVLEKLMPTIIEQQERRLKMIGGITGELSLAIRKVTQLLQFAAEITSQQMSVSEAVLFAWKIISEIPGGYCKNEKHREKHIQDLAAIAEFLQKQRGGNLSIQTFLDQVSLSRRDMLLEADPDRIRLLSAHASKGLEFEAVAMPRLIEPWMEYTDEEARVFYVMLTRAKRHLYMSWPEKIQTKFGSEKKVNGLKYLSAIQPFLR